MVQIIWVFHAHFHRSFIVCTHALSLILLQIYAYCKEGRNNLHPSLLAICKEQFYYYYISHVLYIKTVLSLAGIKAIAQHERGCMC